MARDFNDLRRERYDRDPGAVARVDQIAAKLRDRQASRRWRLYRWLRRKTGR